jgi:predicted transposase/invertase (TIGR01784 family)
LHFKFLQMPLFNKAETELETHFDKWVYFLKNLESFDHIPAILNEPVFQKGFEIAEIAHLKPSQIESYEKSLLEYWELKNVKDTAFNDGKMDEKIEIAKGMLEKGFDLKVIAELTKLTEAEIKAL